MNLNYSLGELVKAAMAFIGAVSASAMSAAPNGVDVSGLDLGQWLTAIGLGLGASGALLHKPKDANQNAVVSIENVATKAIETHDKLTQRAVESIAKVAESAGNLTSLLPSAGLPGIGPLAQQALDSLKD